MTNFFEDLERQLQAAASAQIAVQRVNQRTRRRWIRSTARGIPILLAATTSIVIAALALVLLGHKQPTPPTNEPGGTPPPSSGPPAFPPLSGREHKQIDYVMKADGATQRRDNACAQVPGGRGEPGRKPSLSQGSPSAAMLATLGTLRRPQTPADRLPPRKIWDGPHSTPTIYPYGTYPAVTGIYSRYIHYARHRDGANYYLVPAENVNWRTPVPARCYREQITALRQELPQIPRNLRPGIFALQTTYLAYQRRSTDPYPGVCLSALNSTGNGDGDTCYASSDIATGHTAVKRRARRRARRLRPRPRRRAQRDLLLQGPIPRSPAQRARHQQRVHPPRPAGPPTGVRLPSQARMAVGIRGADQDDHLALTAGPAEAACAAPPKSTCPARIPDDVGRERAPRCYLTWKKIELPRFRAAPRPGACGRREWAGTTVSSYRPGHHLWRWTLAGVSR